MNDAGITLEFDRPFQLWTYSVSHSQLLLRSTKGEGRQTRVDILFKNVSATLVRDTYERMAVRPPRGDEAALIERSSGVSQGPHATYYVIESEPIHFVVAGAMAWYEDEGEYFDPCKFDVVPAPGLAVLDGKRKGSEISQLR